MEGRDKDFLPSILIKLTAVSLGHRINIERRLNNV